MKRFELFKVASEVAIERVPIRRPPGVMWDGVQTCDIDLHISGLPYIRGLNYIFRIDGEMFPRFHDGVESEDYGRFRKIGKYICHLPVFKKIVNFDHALGSVYDSSGMTRKEFPSIPIFETQVFWDFISSSSWCRDNLRVDDISEPMLGEMFRAIQWHRPELFFQYDDLKDRFAWKANEFSHFFFDGCCIDQELNAALSKCDPYTRLLWKDIEPGAKDIDLVADWPEWSSFSLFNLFENKLSMQFPTLGIEAVICDNFT